MVTEDSLWLGKLKKGLREILRGSLSQREAALKYEIGRQTFKRYLQYFALENASEVRHIEKNQSWGSSLPQCEVSDHFDSVWACTGLHGLPVNI